MKKRFSVLICILMLFSIFAGGCGSQFDMGQPKEFVLDDLSITLDDSFSGGRTVSSSTLYSMLYTVESRKMTVYVTSEPFSLLEEIGYAEIPTLKEYTAHVMAVNGIEGDIITENGIHGFYFTSVSEGKEFAQRVYLYEGEDSFWTVRFVVFADDFDEAEAVISKYALSVEVE